MQWFAHNIVLLSSPIIELLEKPPRFIQTMISYYMSTASTCIYVYHFHVKYLLSIRCDYAYLICLCIRIPEPYVGGERKQCIVLVVLAVCIIREHTVQSILKSKLRMGKYITNSMTSFSENIK